MKGKQVGHGAVEGGFFFFFFFQEKGYDSAVGGEQEQGAHSRAMPAPGVRC